MTLEAAIRLLQALAPFAWPFIAVIVVLWLLPTIKQVMRTRAVSIKAGSFQLDVGAAIENLKRDVQDLQSNVGKLPEMAKADEPRSSPATVTKPPKILWVDDFPQNNAFQIDKLRSSGIEVVLVRSTVEALDRLQLGEFDLVISDMGRIENGSEYADAGLLLLTKLRERGIKVPLVFYASQAAVLTYGARAKAAGADITSSTLELYRLIRTKTGQPI